MNADEQSYTVLFLQTLEAEETLHSRGYTKAPCANCGGEPYKYVSDPHGLTGGLCRICRGRGWNWERSNK